ncbi:MAG: amino acid adenylation domain-containing protein, partial [bacterium]|nr:amino acid adenylation domain-containing protein [bacterium]
MLIKKFEEQVEKTPQAIAVHTVHPVLPVHPAAAPGGPCTYKKLNGWANQIAAQITAAKGGDNVALLLKHGVTMIAAILGTLKAGKIYVPLSVDYPEKRLSYLLSDSEAAIIITDTAHEATAQKLAHPLEITTLNIDKIDRNPAPNPQRDTRRRKSAYILYTSGSTGKPKGVVQTHENADYYCRNWIRIFSITAADRMTLFSSFCHDGSVQDVFSALHTGATLYPLNMKNRETAFNLSQYLNREKITIWHSVPSLFTYFCGTLDGKETYPHLRSILLGGEAVRQHEAAIRDKYFPHCILANVYGQTESSVNAICRIKPGENYNKPRIGTPLDETQLHVIDKNDEPVETLQSGEILVSSPYISPGYWKNPQATQKVFAEDEDGGKLYWTGDLGKLLMNDTI